MDNSYIDGGKQKYLMSPDTLDNGLKNGRLIMKLFSNFSVQSTELNVLNRGKTLKKKKHKLGWK